MPLYRLIEADVLGAERLFGDDTTIPILAKGKTVTGRIWTYVPDDRLLAERHRRVRFTTPRTTVAVNTPHRSLEGFSGILQADAYSGFNALFDPARKVETITAAFCWAHARRLFFQLADIAANARRGNNATVISPVALEAVKRIDTLFR